eukprot:m.59264 g.59264  ORF g.59264 m.59264 type:complete len:216 (+) comp7874_c0_seq2:159-806(+)
MSSQQFYGSEYTDTAWVPKTKVVIFDFDKTITLKHTGGSVMLPAYADEKYIRDNFADLEFFQFVAPFIRAQSVQVAIASFGEDDPDGLLSGLKLIRKYLDVAFGADKSKQLFPDKLIALWHPESRGKDDKKVGKQEHIAEILKHLGVKASASEVVLFDDDEQNVKIAASKGMRAFHCKAVSPKEVEKGKTTGFNRVVWKDFVKRKGGSAGGCAIM